MDIISKLKESNLLGRGGASFPTGLKWEAVKNEKAEKKYIICNGSEGEPGVFKDKHILENYPEEVVNGIKIALQEIDNSSAYIYLNKDYFQEFKDKLEKLIEDSKITVFEKYGGYLAGEETTVCNVIEGKEPESRFKPPYPFQIGLFGFPTLINNIETFYYVSRISKNEYKNTRFYSISGDVTKRGVFEFPLDLSLEQVLRQSNNYPDFDFFVQVGGGASGEILLPDELNQPLKGVGAIIVYDKSKTDLFELMKYWAEFFNKENCDRCTPCREGAFRLLEMAKTGKIDREKLDEILLVLGETSFCPLGRSMVAPFKSLIFKLILK